MLAELLMVFGLLEGILSHNIALYPLTGCRSHDFMMREIGMQLQENNNLTWLQTYVFHFNKTQLPIPSHWNRISVQSNDLHTFDSFILKSLWEVYFPVDYSRIWDFRPVYAMIKFHIEHKKFTKKLLELPEFRHFWDRSKPDLVVIDQIINDYQSTLASLHGAPTIQVSNYPLVNCYTNSFNIPRTPAAVPTTTQPFSGQGMSFSQRFVNTLQELFMSVLREFQFFTARFIKGKFKSKINLREMEAKRIFYAARSELFTEVIQPISHRIKFFGCSDCGQRRDHVISLPSKFDIAFDRRPELYENISHNELMTNLEIVKHQLTQLNSTLLERKFVLMSFGTISSVEYMPMPLLQQFLNHLSVSKFNIIWQANGNLEEILRQVLIPRNVYFVSWIPMKALLAHPNIQYVISHGGVNTMNELVMFGVPIFGIPIQGDQASNLHRLKDIGAAEVMSLSEVSAGNLGNKLLAFENSLSTYWSRMSKLASMMNHYKGMTGNEQPFWLNWTLRHGKKLLKRNIFRMSFVLGEDWNLWIIVSFILFSLTAMISL